MAENSKEVNKRYLDFNQLVAYGFLPTRPAKVKAAKSLLRIGDDFGRKAWGKPRAISAEIWKEEPGPLTRALASVAL